MMPSSPQLTPQMRDPKTPAERIRLFRRRQKFRRQLVMVEVDPREVDALIDRGYFEAGFDGTVSAYSPGVRGSARACSPATVRISPIGFRRSPPRSKTCGYDHAFSTVSLAGPVDAMFGKSTIDGLWPSTLEYSFDELGSIALPIGVCMFLAVCKLVPRDEVRPSDPDAGANSSLSMISWILCHPVRAI